MNKRLVLRLLGAILLDRGAGHGALAGHFVPFYGDGDAPRPAEQHGSAGGAGLPRLAVCASQRANHAREGFLVVALLVVLPAPLARCPL